MKLRYLLLVLFSFLVVFFGGFLLGRGVLPLSSKVGDGLALSDLARKDAPADVEFDLFWKVWDMLHEQYFDKTKLDPSKLVYGAISGMVEAVGDPYTIFLDPEQNRVTSEDLNGNFEGIGIQIGFRGTQLAVVSPLPDSPAEAAGVEAGDFILGIKDEKAGVERGTSGITLPEAVRIIRGEAGTAVKLVLSREGKTDPFEVEIVRKSIAVPSVSLSFVGPNESVAHLKLLKFGGETEREWAEAVDKIVAKKVNKLVIDVRNDPGGYLEGAVDIASEFVPVGTTVVLEEHSDGTKRDLKTSREGKLNDISVVVLINKGSASASEILSGALRDIKGVKLVGSTSFGKGTIQERQELEGKVALHITAARWLTPAGIWVHEKGLEPDVTIKDNPETNVDEQLQEAIGLLEK